MTREANPQLHGHERVYPGYSKAFAGPIYETQPSVLSPTSAPVYHNTPQQNMAYPPNQERPYDNQAGPYLNVGSSPLLDITSWTPSSGTQDTKFHVYLTAVHPLLAENYSVFFLMFGQRKCQTSLQKLNQTARVCSYLIIADVPQFSSTGFSVSTVPVAIFMESEDGDVMYKLDVGNFTYVGGGEQTESITSQDVPRKRKISAEAAELIKSPRHLVYVYPNSSTASPPSLKAQSPQIGNWYPTVSLNIGRDVPSNMGISGSPFSTLPAPSSLANPPLIITSLQQMPSPTTTPRSEYPGQYFNAYALYPHKAKLEIQGDLDAMAREWSEDEFESRRRLVLFRREQSGSTITTSFNPVAIDDRPPHSICISCIYWEEKQECFVTGVDTIHLLEQLAAARFTIEEKNRIRRNLEGFRPLTVSKGNLDTDEFFKVIMAFPTPKPRNIEKDVKVFHWKDLSSILKKIIGKFSAGPSSTLPPTLLTSVNSTRYAKPAGVSYATARAYSPLSISSPTNSTAYNSMSIPERVLSPYNQKSMTPQGGSPDLRVSASRGALSIQSSHPALGQSPKMPLCLGGNQTSTRSSSQDYQVPSSPNVQENQTQKSSSSQHSDFSPGCDTISSTTDDDTDWDEDDTNNSLQSSHVYRFSRTDELDQEEIKETLVAPMLSPFKKQLIDRIMKEFWVIFNQESEIIHETKSDVGSTNSSNGPVSMATDRGSQSPSILGQDSQRQAMGSSNKTSRSIGGKYKRDDKDDQDQNNGDERSPKRPRTLLSPPRSQDDSAKFACPYRKRDSRKYCVQHWRSCALTPLETVARVKGHLYRHHRIFPCRRCKVLFKDSDAVNIHLQEPKGCELKNIEQPDGITPEVYERLHSKKVQRDQTEADRWKDIYKLLFPNEMIPSPYFEAIQEDLALSPDSRELTNYEEYCRRELPRDFRAALEEIVHNESQPIEESIRNRLMDIIRDCQDRVFSRYRSTAELTASPPPRPPASLRSSPMVFPPLEDIATTTTELSFQPTTPQSNLQSCLEVPEIQNQMSEVPESIQLSDSGYNNNTPVLHSRSSPLVLSSASNPPLSNSQSHAEFEPLPDLAQARPSTENEDYNGMFTDETFEGSWINFDPGLVEQDDFIQFF